MTIRLLASAALAALLAFGSAYAADLPPRPAAVYKAPAMVPSPSWNWTGFYIGVNGGYGWSPYSNQLALLGDSPTGLHSTGGFGGGQIGYNYQINQIVLGIEADVQGSGIHDTVHDLIFADTFHSELDSFWSVRGRVGVAFDRFLPYVTGGYAGGEIKNSVVGPTLIGSPYNFSGVGNGYTIGGGLEMWIIPKLSLKVEYQYLGLGTHDPTNPAGAHYSAIAGGGFATVRPDNFNTVRAGLNYHF